MNIDVCKNCNKECFICFQSLIDESKNKMYVRSITDNYFLMRWIHSSEKVFEHKPKKWWICIKDRKQGRHYTCWSFNMVNVNLSKDCPYYMEHKLYEWNFKIN